jgi:hypothetical protein
MKYHKNDILIDSIGRLRRVKATLEDLYFLSTVSKYDKFAFVSSEQDLDEEGYTLHERTEEEWEPKDGDMYFYINVNGIICADDWDSSAWDVGTKNFLGIYKTKEQADQALVEIKKKLGK